MCRTARPDVAVIILTCGEFSGLERTLDSVVKQIYPVDAVIVSDDGSGKAFPAALQERYPDIIFQTGEQNIGTVAHMNRTAGEIQSSYIKFLAAGDAFSDPEALTALAAFADDKDTPAVTSQSMVCDRELIHRCYRFPGIRAKRLQKTGAELFRALARSNFISAPGTLLRRSFFTQLGGFDESYYLLEDWPAWMRLAREGYAIPCLDRVTCLHGAGGVSSENLDAYHSPRLQSDMVLCYEKEILPYLDRFPPGEARRVQYGYELARGRTHEELIKKYPWQERRTVWKRGLKRWLLER